MTSTRKIVIGIAVGLAATGAVLAWTLPYWSVAGLLTAAAGNDVERAARFMQEHRVELALRERTSEAVRDQAQKAVSEGWPGAEQAIRTDKSRPLADELSNVAAVTDLIRTHLPVHGSRVAAAWHLMKSDEGRRDGGDYRVSAPGGYEFHWARRGASWQLMDVAIPQHVIEAAAITGEDPVIQPAVQTFSHPNYQD
ncbi:MAG: hypothetical protein ABW136_09795 [Steroidobacteraceae bacterium]